MPAEGELHLHRCGWSPTHSPEKHGQGCGRVFVHKQDTSVSSAVYAERHCCPDCGKGPWQNTWSPGDDEAWAALSEAEKTEIRARAQDRRALNSLMAALFER